MKILTQDHPCRRIAVFVVAASLIHFGAVAIANLRPDAVQAIEPTDPGVPIIYVDLAPAADPAPPPEEAPLPPPPNTTEVPMFRDYSTPPPVRPQQVSRVQRPIARASNPGPVTLSSAKVLALSAPRPEYPYEARRQKIRGSGIVAMTVNPDGSVADVVMAQSTGSDILDNAATTAFRRWRFKPGTISRVRSPITFTMSGASY